MVWDLKYQHYYVSYTVIKYLFSIHLIPYLLASYNINTEATFYIYSIVKCIQYIRFVIFSVSRISDVHKFSQIYLQNLLFIQVVSFKEHNHNVSFISMISHSYCLTIFCIKGTTHCTQILFLYHTGLLLYFSPQF
jgi:hypothetical protein